DANLRVEPRTARLNFRRVRLLVNTPFAAGLPLEMLDHIRHVHGLSIDSRLLESTIQKTAGGTDERPAGAGPGIAWLLPDPHQLCPRRPFSPHGPGAPHPQVARPTAGRHSQEGGQRGVVGNKVSGG